MSSEPLAQFRTLENSDGSLDLSFVGVSGEGKVYHLSPPDLANLLALVGRAWANHQLRTNPAIQVKAHRE